MANTVPYLSFTFDDFPRSALHCAGSMLVSRGLRGTYYTSFGLMGKQAPTGTIFVREDLEELFKHGHEIGCHTYAHCHSWDTSPSDFEASVVENQAALERLAPGQSFGSHSYPITCPRPGTKRRLARHFACSRGGGQLTNEGRIDLNHLRAFFLEKCLDNIAAVREAIDYNARVCGWLILATHDVCDSPTPYGCQPEFFAEVLAHCVKSGARILPVADAWKEIRAAQPGGRAA